ncbi:MAG TPA: hypothetical protein VGD59_14865 [Acidisarcina sp.]
MASAASSRIHIRTLRSPFEYWHLLSLDAPTVAVLWAGTLCRAAHAVLDIRTAVFLALGTWVLYVGDRLLDGLTGTAARELRERHLFHRQHRLSFLAGLIVSLLVLIRLGVSMSKPLFRDFLIVLIAALAYFALVHGGFWCRRWLKKELFVGAIFAAGVAVPAWFQLASANTAVLVGTHPRPAQAEFASTVAIFASLCWLNCAAIDGWEQTESHLEGRTLRSAGKVPPSELADQPHKRVRRCTVRMAAAGVASAALSLCLFTLERQWVGVGDLGEIQASIAICAAAWLLFLLDAQRARLTPMQLRVAADAALLTPLFFLATGSL